MFVFGLIIGAAINGLIVGLIVMIAGKIVVKEAPEFVDAFKACFFAALVGAAVQFALGLALPADDIWIGLGLGLLASYIVYVTMFQMIIGYTMGQAAAVAAVATLFLWGMVFGIGLLIGLLAVVA